MKVTACVYDNGIGETAILGDDETDDVIPDDHSQFLSESSPREMAEVVGEVSGSEDSSVLSSAVVSIASTRSLALSSPLTSTVLPHPSLLSYCILIPQFPSPSPSLHVRSLLLLHRRLQPSKPLPPRSPHCSCGRSNWSATTRRSCCWRSCTRRGWRNCSESPPATRLCDPIFWEPSAYWRRSVWSSVAIWSSNSRRSCVTAIWNC